MLSLTGRRPTIVRENFSLKLQSFTLNRSNTSNVLQLGVGNFFSRLYTEQYCLNEFEKYAMAIIKSKIVIKW